MTQTGTSHAGAGGGAGKVDVQNLVFTKFVDKASPALIKQCCNGKHFDKAILTVRKAGGDALEYLKIELFNGIISQVSVGGSGGPERLTENVGLNFAAFKYSYTPQDSKGGGGAVIPAAWNMATNNDQC
jgi:type VI secretion system secreted protein Hcp